MPTNVPPYRLVDTQSTDTTRAVFDVYLPLWAMCYKCEELSKYSHIDSPDSARGLVNLQRCYAYECKPLPGYGYTKH